jgi:hypothetical protein
MKHIQKLTQGMNTVQAVHSVMRQSLLWDGNLIVLRGETEEGNLANWYDFDRLPLLRAFIFGLMSLVEGEELREVTLNRIPPGVTFSEGYDGLGETYLVALQAFPGVVLTAGKDKESLMVQSGEACWVDSVLWTITNNSQDDLLLLIVHIVPNSPATYVPEEPNADIPA